jgi:uncharacterized protein YbjT (DUF2867 family)
MTTRPTLVLGATGKPADASGAPVRTRRGRSAPRRAGCEGFRRGLDHPAIDLVQSAFSEGFFVDQVLNGEVALPVATAKEPFVDADDIADIAAAALTDDRHIGQLYELTGPRLLTFPEAIDEITRTARREVRYKRVSPEQYASLLAEQNVRRSLSRS